MRVPVETSATNSRARGVGVSRAGHDQPALNYVFKDWRYIKKRDWMAATPGRAARHCEALEALGDRYDAYAAAESSDRGFSEKTDASMPTRRKHRRRRFLELGSAQVPLLLGRCALVRRHDRGLRRRRAVRREEARRAVSVRRARRRAQDLVGRAGPPAAGRAGRVPREPLREGTGLCVVKGGTVVRLQSDCSSLCPPTDEPRRAPAPASENRGLTGNSRRA